MSGTEPGARSGAAPVAPVLFLIDELEVGGSQRQILMLAKDLKRRGHAVTVAYFREAGATLRPEFEAAGIEARLVAKRRRVDVMFLLRLARLLASERRTHVLSFGYTANLWTRLAGSLAAAPRTISCIRDLTYLPRSAGALTPVLAKVEALLATRSRWVVANSQVTAESMVTRGFVPRSKLLVVPNAVEGGAFIPRAAARPRLRALVGGAEPDPIVGTLARLVVPKDLFTLIRAARLVANEIPQTRFLVAGEGPLRGELEALRRQLGLDDSVLMPGTVDGRTIMSGLDVGILTSTHEGMPNFVLEAMATGVPIVSTRAGAVPEILEEGGLGRLVATGDHQGVAQAIVATLRDPAAARVAAERALIKANAMTAPEITGRYLSLFAAS
jgi:glycosyltransferase involved in cell wall biosynthesis